MLGLFILVIVGLLFFAALYIIFYMVFRRNRHSEIEERSAPVGKEYEPFEEKILKGIDFILQHSYEEVYVTSFDGLKLYGRYFHTADGAPLMIFMHGYHGRAYRDGNGAFILSKRRGYNVLMVDQRAHGRSEGKVITFGVKERYDCLQWIYFARERFGENTPIVLAGISMGAATVMMTAGLKLPDNVKGIIADCGYTSPKEIIATVIKRRKLSVKLLYPLVCLSAKVYGKVDIEEVSCVDAMKQSKAPMLFIHGDGDTFVPHRMSQACYEACITEKDILIVKDAAHGLSHCVDSVAYGNAVNAFLDKTVGSLQKENEAVG